MLMVGEVRTGLLHNLEELSEDECAAVLGLSPGELARTSRRPLLYAISPDSLTGVDCRLPTTSQARLRGAGTVVRHATIVGGRVVQGSAYASIEAAQSPQRQPWSHYLARPGVIEVLGQPRWQEMADGLLSAEIPADCLNLGAVSAHPMSAVQKSPQLNRKNPFKASRTHLRWVMTPGERQIGLNLARGPLRTLRLRGEPTPDVVSFCEDLALHDWLLTTLQSLIERARIGSAEPASITARLAPAIDHLLHLWMPGARVPSSVAHLWDELERYPGFTRQWTSSVARIRDQIAVSTLAILSVMSNGRQDSRDLPAPRAPFQQNPP